MNTNSNLIPAMIALSFMAACRAGGDENTTENEASVAPSANELTSVSPAELIEQGKGLVARGACDDCHTPVKMGPNGPEPDMTRRLSGHPESLTMPPAPDLPTGPWVAVVGATMTAWNGPWGTSFTANLTPDADTGLGRWKTADFIATVRTGRHLGKGRPILPPMPIPVLQQYTDDELTAVFAYLQSLPKVKNKVPAPIPPKAAAAPPGQTNATRG